MNGLSTLRKAIKAGELGTIFGTAAEIRPELVRTEERILQLKSRIANFRVLESYRELGLFAANSGRPQSGAFLATLPSNSAAVEMFSSASRP